MVDYLQIGVYVLLIIFLIVCIILGVKLIMTLSKVNDLVENVTEKVKTFDRIFEVINVATNKMSVISDAVVGFLASGVKKIFGKSKKSKKNKEEVDYE